MVERSKYISSCVAPNTQKTYRTGVNHYRRFCAQLGVPHLPLNQVTLELFVVSLASRVGHKSIKVYLCGVLLDSTLSGFSEQIRGMPRLHYVIRGIKVSQGQAHVKPPRVPVTIGNLHTLLHLISQSYPHHDREMLASAVLLAFFGLLRVSEYTAVSSSHFHRPTKLCLQDVWVDISRHIIHLRIKVSKTDPFGVASQSGLEQWGHKSAQCRPFLLT